MAARLDRALTHVRGTHVAPIRHPCTASRLKLGAYLATQIWDWKLSSTPDDEAHLFWYISKAHLGSTGRNLEVRFRCNLTKCCYDIGEGFHHYRPIFTASIKQLRPYPQWNETHPLPSQLRQRQREESRFASTTTFHSHHLRSQTTTKPKTMTFPNPHKMFGLHQ